MVERRVLIIPFLEGKLTASGQLVEPCIESILEAWLQRHPEHRGKRFHVIRPRSYYVGDVSTVLVRVTADFDETLADYDPAEDADLYEEFLVRSSGPDPGEFHRIWIQQCEAAERIESEYGTEKAMGYLIGEKLLNYLGVAERNPKWRAEIPSFVARIKELFEPWQLTHFFETPRRLGVLGHVADEQGHMVFRAQCEDSENLREDARNLLLFEQAREWLLGDEDPRDER